MPLWQRVGELLPGLAEPLSNLSATRLWYEGEVSRQERALAAGGAPAAAPAVAHDADRAAVVAASAAIRAGAASPQRSVKSVRSFASSSARSVTGISARVGPRSAGASSASTPAGPRSRSASGSRAASPAQQPAPAQAGRSVGGGLGAPPALTGAGWRGWPRGSGPMAPLPHAPPSFVSDRSVDASEVLGRGGRGQ